MAKLRKRQQFEVLIVSASSLQFFPGTNRLFYIASPSDFVPMSENHQMRNKRYQYKVPALDNTCEPVVIDGEPKIVKRARFLVLKNDFKDLSTTNIPQTAFNNGIRVAIPMNDGKYSGKMIVKNGNCVDELGGTYEVYNYVRSTRSSSQFRGGNTMMTEEALVKDVRTYSSYGWVDKFADGDMVTLKDVAKRENYISLSQTSSLDAGCGYTHIDINDYETQVDVTNALTMDSKAVVGTVGTLKNEKTVLHTVQPTDGQMMLSPRATARISSRIGQITRREWHVLREAFNCGITFEAQQAVPALAKIWDKISRGYQIRWYLRKGFAFMHDHDYVDANGKQFDIVFPSGAIKDQGKLLTAEEFLAVRMCVANVAPAPKEVKEWGNLNYQFVQSLNIPFNKLQGLAMEAIAEIVKALDSVEDAMRFIGMISTDQEEEDSAVTNLQRLLNANPAVFENKWVQNKIKALMNNTISNMRQARIPVKDSKFVYIITDPATLLSNGAPLLKAGEYYYNGEVGERALFRSPLIHKSEAVVVNLVDNPELQKAFGHIKNVLIMNAYDDTLPRMGGADTDGDKVYMVAHQDIIDSVERDLPLIYGDIAEESKEEPKRYPWGPKAIYAYDAQTMTASQVGIITNYCTTLVDKARDLRRTPEQADYQWNLVTVGRIQQGQIIDDAKRGTQTKIDQRLKTREYPTWLETGKERYVSQSPMGYLYRWVKETIMPWYKNKFGATEFKANILTQFTNYDGSALNTILESVTEMETRYRHDIAAFMEKPENRTEMNEWETAQQYADRQELRNQRFKQLMSVHRDILNSIDAPDTAVGVACLHVAEYAERRSEDSINSYPFVIGTDFVISLLAGMEGNFRLFRLNNADEDLLEEYIEKHQATQLLVNKNRATWAGVYTLGYVKVENGFYDFHRYGNEWFIKVPVHAKTVEVERVEKKTVQFNVKGFQKAFGINAEQLVSKIAEQTIAVRQFEDADGNWLAVQLGNASVGFVGKETVINVANIQNKNLSVIKAEKVSNGVIIVTATVEGEITSTVVATPSTAEPVVMYNDDMYYEQDCFDLTIGM